MIAIFLIKTDRVLLTRRFTDERWQPSCVGDGSGIGDAQRALYGSLGIRERLFDCGSDVYRSVTAQQISTSHEIDEIEWVRIDELPRFVKGFACDRSLAAQLDVLLESLGSSLRV